jgi:tRNA pseudouridine55 synthase
MEAMLHDREMKDKTPDHSGSVLNLYKTLGETPRERLERLRGQNHHYTHEVLSYAGRLDPMAEGVLLCLVAGANKRRETYLGMNKEYVLDVLFGFSTDTYDILGKVMETSDGANLRRETINKTLSEFRGEIDQEYPPFSSQPVEGKSLFEWARMTANAGTSAITSLVLPRRKVNIYNISLTGMYKVKESLLLSYVETSISKVGGDFRQDEILRVWHRYLTKDGQREFPCATIKISCSSGTYVRSIANNMGKILGVPALSLHILRTKVGEYEVEKALK